MTTKWASNWRQTSLRHAEVEVTQFAMDILSAWQGSTPTEPWTNNPLGIPSKGYGAPTALATPYASFPTMQAFREAFKKAVHSSSGKPLLDALNSEGKHAKAWRVINAMGWPATVTESDYPSRILDLAEGKYTATVKPRKSRERTSAGSQLSSPDVSSAFKAQARLLHEAATRFDSHADAIRHIIEGGR